MTKEQYIVKGKDSSGEEIFYAVDSNSGYPYGTAYLPKTAFDIKTAISWLKNCGPRKMVNMDQPKVCRIEYVEVDISEYLQTEKYVECLLNNLNEVEKDVLIEKLKGFR